MDAADAEVSDSGRGAGDDGVAREPRESDVAGEPAGAGFAAGTGVAGLPSGRTSGLLDVPVGPPFPAPGLPAPSLSICFRRQCQPAA